MMLWPLMALAAPRPCDIERCELAAALTRSVLEHVEAEVSAVRLPELLAELDPTVDAEARCHLGDEGACTETTHDAWCLLHGAGAPSCPQLTLEAATRTRWSPHRVGRLQMRGPPNARLALLEGPELLNGEQAIFPRVARRFELDGDGKASVDVEGDVRFSHWEIAPGDAPLHIQSPSPPTARQLAREGRLGRPPRTSRLGGLGPWSRARRGPWSSETVTVVDAEGRPLPDVSVASRIDVGTTGPDGRVTVWTDGTLIPQQGRIVDDEGRRSALREPSQCTVDGEELPCDALPMGTWYRRPNGTTVRARRMPLRVRPAPHGTTLVDAEKVRLSEGLVRGEHVTVTVPVPGLGRFRTQVPPTEEIELSPDTWGFVATDVRDLDGHPVHRVIPYDAEYRGERAVSSRAGRVMMLPGAGLPVGMRWAGDTIVMASSLPRPGRAAPARAWCSQAGPTLGPDRHHHLPDDLLQAFSAEEKDREDLIPGPGPDGRFRIPTDAATRWPGGLRTPDGRVVLWGRSSKRAWLLDREGWTHLEPCP